MSILKRLYEKVGSVRYLAVALITLAFAIPSWAFDKRCNYVVSNQRELDIAIQRATTDGVEKEVFCLKAGKYERFEVGSPVGNEIYLIGEGKEKVEIKRISGYGYKFFYISNLTVTGEMDFLFPAFKSEIILEDIISKPANERDSVKIFVSADIGKFQRNTFINTNFNNNFTGSFKHEGVFQDNTFIGSNLSILSFNSILVFRNTFINTNFKGRFVPEGKKAVFQDNTFRGSPLGIDIGGIPVSASNLVLVLYNNKFDGFDGSLRCVSVAGKILLVKQNVFVNCNSGGALRISEAEFITIKDNWFYNNKASPTVLAPLAGDDVYISYGKYVKVENNYFGPTVEFDKPKSEGFVLESVGGANFIFRNNHRATGYPNEKSIALLKGQGYEEDLRELQEMAEGRRAQQPSRPQSSTPSQLQNPNIPSTPEDIKSLPERKVEETKDRVIRETDRRVQQKVDETINRTINNLFDNLFRR